MEFKTILHEKENGLTTIFLNRPEALNAMNEEMIADLNRALSMAHSDKETRVVILTGKGRAFCAGADLHRFKRDYEHFEKTGEPSLFYDKTLPRLLAFFDKPLLVAVNGPAIGVGMTMVLGSDIRLASELASFSCPFVQAGLTPEFGSSYFLTRLVGYAKAAEWILTGKTIHAEEALSSGLINRVVTPEALLGETRNMALRIASMPEEATVAAKQLLRQAMDSGLDETLERETEVFRLCQTMRSHYLAVSEILRRMKEKV
jgi:2-(1,2-epoxy-1,2-dihydrophenyl)acetyl-CoA isomerase